jgi:hypothetical protein
VITNEGPKRVVRASDGPETVMSRNDDHLQRCRPGARE